jgi:hypothetical protein
MFAFIASLCGVAWFWINIFGAAMSDGPVAPTPWMLWGIAAHVSPVALIVAWWLTPRR